MKSTSIEGDRRERGTGDSGGRRVLQNVQYPFHKVPHTLGILGCSEKGVPKIFISNTHGQKYTFCIGKSNRHILDFFFLEKWALLKGKKESLGQTFLRSS